MRTSSTRCPRGWRPTRPRKGPTSDRLPRRSRRAATLAWAAPRGSHSRRTKTSRRRPCPTTASSRASAPGRRDWPRRSSRSHSSKRWPFEGSSSTGSCRSNGRASCQGGSSARVACVSAKSVRAGYAYDWDEVGRLASATRNDAANLNAAVAETFTYSAYGERIATARQDSGAPSTVYTGRVFDSLVLEDAAFYAGRGDYEHT